MNRKPQKNGHQTDKQHISPGSNSIKVRFALERPEAAEVHLCGDFNQWSPTTLRMIRHDGTWEKQIVLKPGRYEYKFVVDGQWTSDPKAQHDVKNAFGSSNSVLEVSG